MQLAQGHAGGGADFVDGELQRLDPVVQNAVEGLDVAARLVLQRADVLDDEVAGHILGVDDAAQVKAVQDIVELQPVDLGHPLGVRVVAGKEGQQDVLLVHVGQGHKGFGRSQPLAEQEAAVGAVLAEDLRRRQLFGQIVAAGEVPLDDPHLDLVFQQVLAEIEGDGAAAHDHGVFDRGGGDAQPGKKLLGLVRGGQEGDQVPAAQHKAAVGDGDRLAALDRADQDIAAHPGGDVADGHPVQAVGLGQRKLDQLHPPAGKGVDLGRAGEAQQPRNLGRGGHLGVDDGRDAGLLADEIQLVAVGRVAHPGDGVAAARLFGKHAAQQVQLVRAGNGDEHVGVLDAGFGQGGDGSAVAHHAQHIVALDDLLDPGLVGVDDGDAVAFLAELAGQGCAHLAAAHKYDLHSLNDSFLS